jgi:hypothetical protein
MNYNLNDVSVWIILLLGACGFFLFFIRMCDWWRDRMGSDPLEYWRRKRQKNR